MATDWTAPITWSGALVTENNLNEQIRDNLTFLKDPPTDSYEVNEASDYTTTSTAFVDVDSTDLSFSIETAGGDVFAHLHAWVAIPDTNAVFFELDVDGSPVGGDDGIIGANESFTGSGGVPVCFTRRITGLAAGTHVFTLQWKVTGGTATMYAGAGTSNRDVHPQFWVREMS